MLRFIATRLLQLPLILAVIYLLTFALAWLAPGSPFEGDRKLDPAVVERLKRQFHAEKWYTFLVYYPRNVLTHGDFGPSMEYKDLSFNDVVKSSLPVRSRASRPASRSAVAARSVRLYAGE